MTDQSHPFPPEDAHLYIHEMFEYWNGRRAGRAYPDRSDIDPSEVAELLSYITLVDVGDGDPRFVYRVVGSFVTRLLGQDPINLPVGTGVIPDRLEQVLARYTLVADTGEGYFHRTELHEERNDFTTVDRLMLPLGPPDEPVGSILCVVVPVGATN